MIELKYFYFLTFIGVITATQLQFKSCHKATDKGTINDVTSEPCVPSGDVICAFQKGNIQQVNVTFTPDIDVSSAHIKVIATIPGIGTMDAPFPNTNICDNILKCPLKAKEQYTTITNMPIGDYPTINLVIEYNLKDDENNTIACFKIPVAIIEKIKDESQITNVPYASTSTTYTSSNFTESEREVSKRSTEQTTNIPESEELTKIRTKQTTNIPFESTSTIIATSNFSESETEETKTSTKQNTNIPYESSSTIYTPSIFTDSETEITKTSTKQTPNLPYESTSTTYTSSNFPESETDVTKTSANQTTNIFYESTSTTSVINFTLSGISDFMGFTENTTTSIIYNPTDEILNYEFDNKTKEQNPSSLSYQTTNILQSETPVNQQNNSSYETTDKQQSQTPITQLNSTDSTETLTNKQPLQTSVFQTTSSDSSDMVTNKQQSQMPVTETTKSKYTFREIQNYDKDYLNY